MRLLGGFALGYQGASVAVTSPRMQALLAYLALHRAAPQPRRWLAFLLWTDSSEAQAQTNLRTLLLRLHAALSETVPLIHVDAQTVAWQPAAPVSLDVLDFEEAVHMANSDVRAGDEAAAITALEHAAACYTGDLLPDCYDEWVLPERERLRQVLIATLAHLVTLLEQRRTYAAAITHMRRLVKLDPLNEAHYLTLLRLHATNGDRAGALRVYHTCVSTLQTELGASPGAALVAAYERLLAAELPSLVDAPSASQVATAPLIGRDSAWRRMVAIWQTVSAGQARLLMLSGEAGIGKTRLGEELLRWAGHQGAAVAVARCYAAESELAYAPITAWLCAETIRSGLARLDLAWLSEVARLRPEILAAHPEARPPGPLTQSWQRQRLFESLARAIRATQQPLLLLIDDLQWCDRDSLEWLHYLLRCETRTGLLVVGTVRVEEVGVSHSLSDLLNTLRREGRMSEIALDPLNAEETGIWAAPHCARAGAGRIRFHA